MADVPRAGLRRAGVDGGGQRARLDGGRDDSVLPRLAVTGSARPAVASRASRRRRSFWRLLVGIDGTGVAACLVCRMMADPAALTLPAGRRVQGDAPQSAG